MSDNAIFFEKQLEYIKPGLYDVMFPNLQFASGELIPIDSSVPTSAETITYNTYTRHGIAKIISDYSTDFANADISGKQTTSAVKSVGSSFQYSIQELRAAEAGRMNLQARKAEAAIEAIEQKMDSVAIDGDPDSGLFGLLTHPNIGEYVVPNGALGSQLWENKTPAEILKDMNSICSQSRLLSKGVEKADTLLIPDTNYEYIQTTPRSGDSDLTILEYFKRNKPEITVVSVPKFTGKGQGGSGVMVAYERNSMKLTFEIPQAREIFPAQQDALVFKVLVHARTGGVIIYYPLSVTKAEGI
jgi:hypothetical protein